MNQELQIKAIISDIETKTDKNNQPYYRISCQGLPARYFYVFSTDYQLNLNQDTLKIKFWAELINLELIIWIPIYKKLVVPLEVIGLLSKN